MRLKFGLSNVFTVEYSSQTKTYKETFATTEPNNRDKALSEIRQKALAQLKKMRFRFSGNIIYVAKTFSASCCRSFVVNILLFLNGTF